MACVFASAFDDVETLEILDDVERLNDVKQHQEQKNVVDYYVEQRTTQFENSRGFIASKLSHRNTFLWYIWNDYEAAKGFEKIKIGEQIYDLTR